MAEPNFPLVAHIEYFYVDFIALAEWGVVDVLNSRMGDFRNVAKPFLARENFDKKSELHHRSDPPVVNFPDLRLSGEAVDDLLGPVHRIGMV